MFFELGAHKNKFIKIKSIVMLFCALTLFMAHSSEARAYQASAFCYSLFSPKPIPNKNQNLERDLKLAIESGKVDLKKTTVVIVNGYSSGKFLGPAFKNQGVQVIHIHANGVPNAEHKSSYKRSSYDFDISYTGDLNETLNILKQFSDVKAIMPGQDAGVLLSQQLAESFKKIRPEIPADDFNLAWKDKFLQSEALRLNGIDHIKQIQTSSAAEALAWVENEALLKHPPFKIAIKPVMGVAGKDFVIAHSLEEVRATFKSLIGKRNDAGEVYTSLLVQEFLEGDEYVVNTTSLYGHHVVTDLWHYKKSVVGDTKVYDEDRLISFEGKVQRELIEYNRKVLAALGQNNFNGHMEIMYVQGRGPVLIEHNTRMMGSGLPKVAEMATGHSQIDRTILAVLNPREFMKLNSGYTIHKFPGMATFINRRKDGEAKLKPDAEKIISTLPGFSDLHMNASAGQALMRTKNLYTTIGEAVFYANSEAERERFMQMYKSLETNESLIDF